MTQTNTLTRRSLTRRSLFRRNMILGAAIAFTLPAAASKAAAPKAGAPGNEFAAVDALALKAVSDRVAPGVVLAIGHRGNTVHRFTCGARALIPQRERMTADTVFDMASLTKPTITALAVMQLAEQGKLGVEDKVTRYFPDFAANGKGAITLRLLLTHYSGLPPDLPLDTPWTGKEEAVRLTMQSPLANPPGTKFVYSDINFITLGLIVEKVSGLALNDYAARNILAPLGMTRSGFLPDPSLRPLIAPTQYDEHGAILRGVVHDPTARRMGGVAGHAGLFSDARDMSLYAAALLGRLAGRESAFPLKKETLEQMVTPQSPPGKTDLRGFGWDIATHYSTPRGDLFSSRSFGHTGFTGTSLWMDPVNDASVLILTNRVHPDGGGGKGIVALRRDIATAAAKALGV